MALPSASRFHLVIFVLLALAGYSLGQWPDPVTNEVLPYETTGMVHGPLLGRVSSTSIRIWIRTSAATQFEIAYAKQLPLDATSGRSVGATSVAHDLTGTVTLDNLEPNTRYYYGVQINGQLADLRNDFDSPWPSFRTLPDENACVDAEHNPDGRFNLTFAVGHCASQAPIESGGQYASTPAYRSIAKESDVAFAIVNGDVIYEADRDGTIGGVRKNYSTYFSRGDSFTSLFRHVPGFFTFDDHDVGWDIHGCGQVGLGEGAHLIRDIGLQAYRENLAWANYSGTQTGTLRFGNATVEQHSDVLSDPDADFTKLNPQTVSTIHLGNYTRGAKTPKRDSAPKNAGVYGLVGVIDATHLRITPKPKFDEQLSYSIGTHHYYDWQGSCPMCETGFA